MFIYGVIIFVALYLISKTIIVNFVCRFCNIEKIFETKKGSFSIVFLTNVLSVVFSICSYIILVKIGIWKGNYDTVEGLNLRKIFI